MNMRLGGGYRTAGRKLLRKRNGARRRFEREEPKLI